MHDKGNVFELRVINDEKGFGKRLYNCKQVIIIAGFLFIVTEIIGPIVFYNTIDKEFPVNSGRCVYGFVLAIAFLMLLASHKPDPVTQFFNPRERFRNERQRIEDGEDERDVLGPQ